MEKQNNKVKVNGIQNLNNNMDTNKRTKVN